MLLSEQCISLAPHKAENWIAKLYTYALPQIIAQAFISFQQPFTPATKSDRQLNETGIYY